MKYDIIIAGVGGQGGLSVSIVLTQAALASGLRVKQSEVHGMSQRGGEVLAHMRISDSDVASPLIPRGTADLILSFEAIEGFRYLDWLKPGGAFVTASDTVVNIGNYPDAESVARAVKAVPGSRMVDAQDLARKAGNARGANMVLVGAVASLLPMKEGTLEEAIRALFERKGQDVVDMNLKAFGYGREHS